VNEQIFDQLAWAGYLTDWPGPEIGERPSAYIVMLHDTAIAPSYLCDDGIAAQSILLGATEEGYGGCMIYSVNRPQLREILKIQEQYQIIQVLALGKPKETVVLDEVQNGEIRYWRGEDMVHHVPKRTLEELVIQTI
jgi:nitroreductase